ncbi:hypothetical protein ROHU_002379 [Labeo rohita]|uniref:PARP catalytic domain-containing protein n=2 Tax=Labeo rohita TaxID=84645 RepID=A0A498P0I7_LABRO|nr:hypothetical protein ROHU_002379 [Labeo rohita]
MWGGNGSTFLQGNTNPVSGQVYTMYHGTSMEAAKKIRKEGFCQSAGGMLGRGVYLSRDLEKARRYPLNLQAYQRVVLKVRVSVGKVKKIDCQGHPLQNTWHDHGYDTAWCPPKCGMVPSGLEEDCVWDPQRIQVIEMLYPFLENETISFRSDIRGANMWAEDDLGPGAPPCLDSYRELVDDRVYTMYHGTSRKAAEKIKREGFHPSSDGMFGRGVYLSRDLQKASRYPLDLPENQRVIVRVKVNVGRVIKIDYQGHPLQKIWHDHGYDTAWCPPNCGMVQSGLEGNCVWDSRRITVIDVIHPNMWAEDNLAPGAPPCLDSYRELVDDGVYTMYHGTSRKAAEKIKREGFHPSSDGMFGRGVYLSRDLQKASRYPLDLPENQRVIVRVKINVGRVIKIDYQGHPLQKIWHDRGYDTAWCPPKCGMVPSGLEENCVWDSRRITVIDVIHPNMRAEDNLGPGAPPCLDSYRELVDDRVYTMYHGTSRKAAEKIKREGFHPSSDGMFGRGVYLSRDLQKASRYPLDLPENQRVIVRVKVNVGRVIKIDYQGLKMWAEDDLYPGVPCLQSTTEPVNGNVYRMYHRTTARAAEQIKIHGFRPSADDMLGRGVYLSRDLNKASRYPLDKPHERAVIRVMVNVGRVKKIDYQGHPLQKTWHDHGYNTA